jgi:uncharacterized protein YndB with AHSA1/START domain
MAVSFTFQVNRSIGQVYDLLGDLSQHERWCDHFLVDWKIDGDPRAVGAVLRARATGAGKHDAVEITTVESRPERIAETGRGGKDMKRGTSGVYEMRDLGADRTEVTFTNAVTKWANPFERLFAPAANAYLRKQSGRAMERLKEILDSDA